MVDRYMVGVTAESILVSLEYWDMVFSTYVVPVYDSLWAILQYAVSICIYNVELQTWNP